MADSSGNRILKSLSAPSLAALRLQVKEFSSTSVLAEEGQVPRHVFFPHDGAVVSIVRSALDGSTVEAGVIGGEGLLPLKNVITTPAPGEEQAIVQAAGASPSLKQRWCDSTFWTTRPSARPR